MRRSFVRLIVRSVLVCWVVGIAAAIIYGRSRSWVDERAQGDGVFLAHEILDAIPAGQRAERLEALRPHHSVPLSLISLDAVADHIGRPISPGQRVPHRASGLEEWYFLAFGDGRGALAAGPVHPSMPKGFLPIGMIVAAVGMPVLAGLLTLRVEREIAQVERASEALAVGQFDARVGDGDGPSNELAARFDAMAERIERLVRSRHELVQAVSHELGSPLARLRFHIELLETGGPEQGADRLAAMAREVDALEGLVGELLGYVQTDDIELDARAFDPTRTLVDLAELARLEGPEEHAIAIDVDLCDGVRVVADPRLFQRAVENVLRNAVRFAERRVRLESSAVDGRVCIAVCDDGPGIPEALRAQVVTPFFRVDGTRGRETGGVGLGLAIVSRIVDRHGGHIEIGDGPAGGARVALYWPSPSISGG